MCGGVAAHLGIDPLILRVLIVVLSIFGGTGLLLYAAGWLLIPEDGQDKSIVQDLVDGRGSASRDGNRSFATSVVVTIIVIGALIGLASIVGSHWWFGGPDIWPLLIIGGVAAAIWYTRRQRPVGGPTGPMAYGAGYGPTPYRPAGYPPPAPEGAAYSTTQQTAPEYETSANPQGYLTSGYPGAQDPGTPTAQYPTAQYPSGWSGDSGGASAQWAATAGYAASGPPTGTVGTMTAPQTPPHRRERSVLGLLTWSVALVAAGVMVLLDQAGAWHVRIVPFCAVLLGIIGLGLLVGTVVGRSRGLIVGGILLSLVTMVAAAAPGIDSRRAGQVTWTPTSVSALPAGGYHWGAGDVRLNLDQLALSGQTVSVHAQVGAGRLVVSVPAAAAVTVHADVGLGSVRLLDGQQMGGVGRSYQASFPAAAQPGTGTINLIIDLGAGNLEVNRAQA